MKPKENLVLIDKNAILDFVNNFQKEYEVEVPEWEEISNGILLVRPAELDDHLIAKDYKLSSQMVVEYAKKCKEEGTEIEKEELDKIKEMTGISQKTMFEIIIFQRCVTRPLFSLVESLRLSKVYPAVVNRVARYALKLTTHKGEINGSSNETS